MRNFLAVEKRTGFTFWLLLILLTAVSLRLYHLNTIPPGLTHDEADHGITAVSILNGTREIYFTIGYGREPLFDYATAGLMALLGQTGWALRGTAVFFSLIMIGAMTAWTRLAFNNRVALLTAAGLAIGFWPVMTARQGLRSITLPALFSLSLYFFWRGLQKMEIGAWRLETNHTAYRLPLTDYRSPVTDHASRCPNVRDSACDRGVTAPGLCCQSECRRSPCAKPSSVSGMPLPMASTLNSSPISAGLNSF